MKTLLSLVAAILLCTMSLSAQKPIQDTIPQLKEWWVAPPEMKGLGSYGVSYIPNFYHGINAMAVSIKDGTMQTWLNRFPGDTTNIFSWKGGGPVLQGDFNGDGITDYYAGGYVYRGIQNGEPPDSVPVLYKLIVSEKVFDVNNDGYDDVISIVSNRFSEIVEILYGASDLKAMKWQNIVSPASIDSTMEIDHSYMGADGDMRFIAFTYLKQNDPRRKFNGYILFKAHWNNGDTLPVVEKLSEIIRYEDTDLSFDRGGGVYNSKHTSSKFFIARESLVKNTNHFNFIMYDITNDTFQEKIKFRLDGAFDVFSLRESIDDDDYEDLAIRQGRTFLFYSGKNLPTGIPFASYRSECDNYPSNSYTIGDITNDGIPDIALAVEDSHEPTCFKILEGKKGANGVIEENTVFSLTDASPYPLKRDKPSIMNVVIPKNGKYFLEIFTLNGQRIGELNHPTLEAGHQSLVVDVSSFPLSAGTYLLKLKSESGNIIGQRIIIIE